MKKRNLEETNLEKNIRKSGKRSKKDAVREFEKLVRRVMLLLFR